MKIRRNKSTRLCFSTIYLASNGKFQDFYQMYQCFYEIFHFFYGIRQGFLENGFFSVKY